MSTTTKQPVPQCHSYLLRLWRADKDKAWRMMIECVDTHERHGFAGVEGLCTFLREQMNDESQTGRE
jgi:hypothetical protein